MKPFNLNSVKVVLWCLLSVCYHNATGAQINNITLESETLAYSEIMPIYPMLNHWGAQSTVHDGSAFLKQKNIVSTDVSDNLNIGLGWRYDYSLSASADFTKLYAAGKNGQAIDSPKEHELSAKVDHFSANIVQAKYQWQVNERITIKPTFGFLQADKLTKGKMDFTIRTEGLPAIKPTIESGEGTVNYIYDSPHLHELELLDWNPSKPTGYGYITNLGVFLRSADGKINSELTVNDLSSVIYWKNVPQTRFNSFYTSQPLDYALEGKVETLRRAQQRIPTSYEMKNLYIDKHDLSWRLDAYKVYGVSLERLGLELPQKDKSLQYGLGVWLPSKAIELEAKNKNFHFILGMNDTNYKQSEFLTLSLTYTHLF